MYYLRKLVVTLIVALVIIGSAKSAEIDGARAGTLPVIQTGLLD